MYVDKKLNWLNFNCVKNFQNFLHTYKPNMQESVKIMKNHVL